MSGHIWLDEMIDPATRDDLETHAAEAIDKDAGLRKLAAATPMLRNAVARAVSACLHVDPLAVLADGWRTAKDIRAYRDGAASAPGQPVVLTLGHHSLERDLTPAVTVHVGGDHRFDLPLGLTLSGTFEGAEITIHEGKLISVGAGICSLSLAAAVAGKFVLSRKLAALRLPAEYRFVQPLALY